MSACRSFGPRVARWLSVMGPDSFRGCVFAVAGVLPCAVCTADANADDETDASPPADGASAGIGWDVRFSGMLGGFGQEGAGGPMLAGTVVGRLGPFEGGALLQTGGAPFQGTGDFVTLALLAGLGVQDGAAREGGFRFELLGELGTDEHSRIGQTLLSGPGGDASVGVIGARLGFGYRFRSHRAAQGGLGLWFTFENEESRSVTYSNCGLFNCSEQTSQVGGMRVGVLVAGTVDVGP